MPTYLPDRQALAAQPEAAFLLPSCASCLPGKPFTFLGSIMDHLQALCKALPFLPNKQVLAAQPEAAFLDRHFRMLREDLVGPVREGL